MTALNYIIEDLRIRAEKAEAQLDESRYASAANRADAAGARCIELEKENDRLRTALAQAEAERDALRDTLESHGPDGHNVTNEQYVRLRARAEKAEARLQEVVDKVAEQRLDGYRELGQRVAEAENRLDSERARANRYLAAITEYVQATAAEEQAEEAYTSFGSRMMDRSLPPVTDEDVNAAFTAVANARNRAYAATTAIRAIVEEARRG